VLTKGDSLGGAMRNIVGSAAAVIFTESLLAALEAAGILPQVDRSPANNEKLVAVSWPTRLILVDRKPKIIGKNVDVILLDSTGHADSVRSLLARPERYLACGELKGGIDPAGADEHWKTASGALERIRTALAGMNVRLFFVGAAIEDSMAGEIFSQLQSEKLTYAANLLSEQQLSDLTSWLISI
jgi:type II restriction enzyme